MMGYALRSFQANEGAIMMEPSEKEEALAQIDEALHYVDDPELGVNIIDLGLIYDVAIDEKGYVTIAMTLTTPGCPMHESLGEGVGYALEGIPGVTGGEIRLVWDPPWEPSRMTEDGRKMLGFF
jgi:metal-sulfur cluster biosynthetic enzyme